KAFGRSCPRAAAAVVSAKHGARPLQRIARMASSQVYVRSGKFAGPRGLAVPQYSRTGGAASVYSDWSEPDDLGPPFSANLTHSSCDRARGATTNPAAA